VTDTWTLAPSDGELLVRTGVAGPAARIGHRLTIEMARWRATVRWDGQKPVAAELFVAVDSLEVLRGEGGVKGLSGPEKAVIKSNALKSLGARRFPEIRFTADAVVPTDGGYRLDGELTIRDTSHDHVVELRTVDLGDAWRISAESAVAQQDYGVKPYSILMGSVRVADDVLVSFDAVRPKG
jgi:polyisoprenoid-binding protein YceI